MRKGVRTSSAPAIVICTVTLSMLAAVPPDRKGPHPVGATGMAEKIKQAGGTRTVAPGSTGPAVVRAQILLDRARFSPGEIDGKYGDDLGIAIRSYQESHDLKVTRAI